MSLLSLVRPGWVVIRVYFTVPDPDSLGTEFDTFDEAAAFARGRFDDLLAKLAEKLTGTPEVQLRAMVSTHVRIDSRMVFQEPGSDLVVDDIVDTFRAIELLPPATAKETT